MSVIVKDKGVIKLYIKGADSLIIDRLNKQADSQPYLAKNKYFIDEFSKQGLRTLAIGMKILSEKEYL